MPLTESLAEYEAHDRAWMQEHPWVQDDDCLRRGHCALDWPASTFAWCPPCRLRGGYPAVRVVRQTRVRYARTLRLVG